MTWITSLSGVTAIFTLGVVEVLAAGLLFIFWRLDPFFAGMKQSALASLLGGIAAFAGYSGFLANKIEYVAICTFLFVPSLLLWTRAGRGIRNLAPLKRLDGSCIFLAFLGNTYFGLIEPSLTGLILVLSSLTAVIGAIMTRDFFSENRPEFTLGSRVVGWVFSLFTVSNLLNLVLRPGSAEGPLVNQLTVIDTFSAVGGISLVFSLQICFVWMSYTHLACKLKAAVETAEREARKDPLTNLKNRRAFFEKAEDIQFECTKHHRFRAVIAIDIDHFKSINDEFGHDGGDEVLKTVAKTLCTYSRDADALGRLGGEEFVLVLPDADENTAFQKAEEIRKLIESTRIKTRKGTVEVTASLGVTASNDPAVTSDDMLFEADTALYRAKDSGRNRVICFSSLCPPEANRFSQEISADMHVFRGRKPPAAFPK